MKRTDRFHVLLSADERYMLEQLAVTDGVDGAHVVRALLRSAFKASGLHMPAVEPTAPSKKRPNRG